MQPLSSQNDQTASRSLISFVISLALIVGVAYLGRKVFTTVSAFHIIYYGVTVLAVLNVLYYGWILRVLKFGQSLRTVTGGAAVAASLLYLVLIVGISGYAWASL